MENENQNFDQLTKLLALKKYELPPPGYFNKLPGEVISRIRAERAASVDPVATLKSEAPWLVRLWQSLEAKPAFAGAFGTAICAVVLAAIFFAEKPVTPPNVHTIQVPGAPSEAPLAKVGPPASGFILATNQNGVNLFELSPTLQTAPASFNP